MLLLCSSSHGLNSLFGLKIESKLSSRRSVQPGNGDGQLFHHEVQPRFERALSEADLHDPLSNGSLHDPLSNGSLRKLGLRSGSGTLQPCRKLSTEKLVSNVVLDEALKEEFEDSDTQISIGFQSACDPQEECGGKNIAAIGDHGSEGSFVSKKRNDHLMSGMIFEGTGVDLVCDGCDGIVDVSKTAIGSVNGGFRGEGGGGYGGRGDRSRPESNSTDAYYKKMLRADPGNPLMLTNYARFLQEASIEESELRLCCYILLIILVLLTA